MHIDIAPETERLVRDEINSGHFRSVDEMIKAAAEAWRERHADLRPLSKEENVTPGQAQPRRPLSARIREIWADMPDDVRAEYPEGGAYQIDHHLYGLPKR
jgi:Arc/MetJ-type ribon-helix-helix transcriptional regulator